MDKKVLYGEMRPQEFIDAIAEAPIGYLPLGTLEWHGYHMPLGADYLQSEGFFRLLAKEVGGVVFPPLFLGPDIEDGKGHYGMDICSFEEGRAEQLEGSCYHVPEDLFGQMMKRITEDAARAGIQLLVAHGHGPSMNYVRTHQSEFAIPVLTLFDIACPEGDEGFQSDHAAAIETSLTMVLTDSLVDMEELEWQEFPLASWGRNPRLHASREFGEDLIRKNLEKATATLRGMVPTLGTTERKTIQHGPAKRLCD